MRVRRMRLRLGNRHHGRAEPAQDAYLAALVDLPAPNNLLCFSRLLHALWAALEVQQTSVPVQDQDSVW